METRQFAETHKVSLEDVQNDGILAIMVRLYELLTAALDTIRKTRSGTSVGVKKATEAVRANNPDAKDLAYSLADEIRTTIFAALPDNPEASFLVLEELANIAEEVREVRKLVLAGMDIEDVDESEDVDITEHLEIANFAKDMLNNYSTLLGVLGHSLDDLPDNMRRTNKAGETALSLPKVPSATTEGKSGAGRPVSGGRFTYKLNNEEVPTSGFDRLAVFYCSTVTNRINGSELKDLIKAQTGLEWSDKGNEQYTVTVPAGTLSATLVKG